MENKYYCINIDTRFVLKSSYEIVAQKINSMALDSTCLLLKGDMCIELIKFMMLPRVYSEIKEKFNGNIMGLNELLLKLINHNIISVRKLDVIL
jgi:hypothetical protein